MRLLGKDPLDKKTKDHFLSPKIVGDVIKQYMVSQLLTSWGAFNGARDMVTAHLNRHFDKNMVRNLIMQKGVETIQ